MEKKSHSQLSDRLFGISKLHDSCKVCGFHFYEGVWLLLIRYKKVTLVLHLYLAHSVSVSLY